MAAHVAIKTRWAREAVLIGHVVHGATHEKNERSYIWCFGDISTSLIAEEPEGTPVQCLRCLVYGPRGEWESRPMAGYPRSREESREGVRVIAVDTETDDYSL